MNVSPLAGTPADVRRRGKRRSFIHRIDGSVWTTDKDGIVPALLAAEISAHTGRDPGERVIDRAPGNNAPIGGIKVVAANGWFAARPPGTEDIYKIYAESFRGEAHLRAIVGQAQQLVDASLSGAARANTSSDLQPSMK